MIQRSHSNIVGTSKDGVSLHRAFESGCLKAGANDVALQLSCILIVMGIHDYGGYLEGSYESALGCSELLTFATCFASSKPWGMLQARRGEILGLWGGAHLSERRCWICFVHLSLRGHQGTRGISAWPGYWQGLSHRGGEVRRSGELFQARLFRQRRPGGLTMWNRYNIPWLFRVDKRILLLVFFMTPRYCQPIQTRPDGSAHTYWFCDILHIRTTASELRCINQLCRDQSRLVCGQRKSPPCELAGYQSCDPSPTVFVASLAGSCQVGFSRGPYRRTET